MTGVPQFHAMVVCAARTIDAGKAFAAVVVGSAVVREAVAGWTLLADLVRGIADQPGATVAVMLTWMPGRDTGRFAMPIVANQTAATVVVDRAGSGERPARRHAIPMRTNQPVAAIVGVIACMRHRGAGRSASAAF